MRFTLATLALVSLVCLLPACGGPDTEEATQTPYGQSPGIQDPGAQTPYAQTPVCGGRRRRGTRPQRRAGEGRGRGPGQGPGTPPGRADRGRCVRRPGDRDAAERGLHGHGRRRPRGGHARGARSRATPRSRRRSQWLAAKQKEDGAIFDNPAFVNYMTSAAVGAFAAAKVPAFRNVQAKGMDFLAESQIAGDESDPPTAASRTSRTRASRPTSPTCSSR